MLKDSMSKSVVSLSSTSTNTNACLFVAVPHSKVLWWHAASLTNATIVGSSPFLHLQYAETADGGVYYCTDEYNNYDLAHSVTHLVVLQHSPFGPVFLLKSLL